MLLRVNTTKISTIQFKIFLFFFLVINVLKVGDNVINGDVKVPTIGVEKKIGQNASPGRVISEKVLAKIWLENIRSGYWKKSGVKEKRPAVKWSNLVRSIQLYKFNQVRNLVQINCEALWYAVMIVRE